MKKTVNLFLIIYFLFIVASVYSLSEGEKSPAIIMKASNGDVFNPAKNGRDKYIILSFFSENCIPCIKEIPELQKLQDVSKRFIIYLVADVSTDEKKAKVFLKKIKNISNIEITLPLVYDVYSDMKQSFKVNEFPSLFLINKNGIIKQRFDGYMPDNLEKLKRSINDIK